ncbi:MAG TPA: alpha-hydroxy acid oxidase, partial [Solirubrobacteraceae bacterium]|nr:alpha-hydroxy acid oxidase [Solirubrobacteraceae bacterium]
NITARANIAAFEEIFFRPRCAVSHSSRDQRTTVLGHQLSMPVIASSVGMLGLGHSDGEVGVARAAGAAGTIMFVSGATTTPIEEIMAAATGPIFYQLYYVGGRDASAAIIERVKRAGCHGLVVTVDAAAPLKPQDRPYRDRAALPAGLDVRSAVRFAPQILARPAWLLDFLRRGHRHLSMPMALRGDGSPMRIFEASSLMYSETPTWEDLAWIRERWDGPIVVKGVLTAADARRAVGEGVDGIVVSNHGGNGLDGAAPTLRVLPEIVDAVDGRVDVLLDGGVRRGTDVVKAIAVGATAVSLGRAYVFALMAAGEPGVLHIFELFRNQIDDALAFLGCQSVGELGPSHLEHGVRWATL